jgi:hypothetical protein
VFGQSIAKHASNFTFETLDLVRLKLDHPAACDVDQMTLAIVQSRCVAGQLPLKRVALNQPKPK